MKTPDKALWQARLLTGLLTLSILAPTGVSFAQTSADNQPDNPAQLKAKADQNKEKLAQARKQKEEAFPQGRHNLKDETTRAEIVRRLKEAEDAHMEIVRERAAMKGLEPQGTRPDGRGFRLIDFDENDQPVYEIDENVNAAISTAADQVRSSPIYNNVDGSGVTIGLWEATGIPRLTHQELVGRVTVLDGSTGAGSHATHVAGTLIATGINSSVEGMAPGAEISAFKTSQADAEMLANGADSPNTTKLYISNHSYGVGQGWESSSSGSYSWVFQGTFVDDDDPSTDYDEDFGRYASSSVTWDNITYSLPYYLPFISSGNQRGDNPSNGQTVRIYGVDYTYDNTKHPLGDRHYKGDWDNMEGRKLAKNAITVGNASDAVSGGVRDASNAVTSSSSSRGPTDDGRIKPDIVANGVSLLSTDSGSDTDTGTKSGTSMATPNACGSAALLLDYFTSRFPTDSMRASTLKALIIHTADDRGNDGPDYKYGWGLMNTQAAADVIKLHADGNGGAHMLEDLVNDTTTTSQSHLFESGGSTPLRVTICWTDPAGTEKTGHENRSKTLVNDLNITVTGPGGTHYPYVMPHVGDWSIGSIDDDATTGVNDVDNVEQVYLAAPTAGTYTVTVDYVGSLTDDEQAYSLIVSGTTIDAPTLEVTTATYDILATPPTFSTDDLAQTEYLSSSATGGNQSSEHAQLFNGTIGNTDGDRDDSGEVQLDSGNTITVNLDTSVYISGYDLTGIETIFGWNNASNGRSNQGYEIILTYMNDSTATLAGPTHWEPNSPAQFWTKVSFADDEGGVLQSDLINHNGSTSSGTGAIASGVKAVTFNITNNANAGSWVIAREFDIFGYPTGGPYTELQSWRLEHFGTSEGTGNYADDADFDNDGNLNLMEFALATDPSISNIAPVTFTDNTSTIDLMYDRNVDAMVDYNFQVEWNDDLTNAGGWFDTNVTEQILSNNGSVQEVKATAPKGTGDQRFFQLSVSPK
ncbi:MAG: S8 family serine peptidase [Opitutaceae bacterium]